jgi:hypothetical protein
VNEHRAAPPRAAARRRASAAQQGQRIRRARRQGRPGMMALPLGQQHGHMVHSWFRYRMRELAARRAVVLEHVAAANTLAAVDAEVEDYAKRTGVAVEHAFSPRPERCPLNAETTRTLSAAGGVRIDCVHFDSLPGLPVTANLYLPAQAAAGSALPCVLFACGHSADGKACPAYQQACTRLVHAGFVVLVYDPINQGERDMYARALPAAHIVRQACTCAHNMMGKQQELLGDFFGMWRAWDGIRALDYLLDRPEVDQTRVGLTGNSGGGTMTAWLWALDERFTMAAPSCFITTFERNLANEL